MQRLTCEGMIIQAMRRRHELYDARFNEDLNRAIL